MRHWLKKDNLPWKRERTLNLAYLCCVLWITNTKHCWTNTFNHGNKPASLKCKSTRWKQGSYEMEAVQTRLSLRRHLGHLRHWKYSIGRSSLWNTCLNITLNMYNSSDLDITFIIMYNISLYSPLNRQESRVHKISKYSTVLYSENTK